MIRELISLVEHSKPGLATHLLQSTLFAIMISLLVSLLSKNRARVRHWLWLTASVKFLIPFSLLVALGSLFPKQQYASFSQPVVSAALSSVGQPFSGPAIVPGAHMQSLHNQSTGYLLLVLVVSWACGTVTVLVVCGIRWRQVSASLKQAVLIGDGREAEILQRIEALAWVRGRVVMLGSPHMMEPGIFGIFRPVMLWPLRLTERLEDEHIESILVHELMHIRRHDNLIAAIHMVVEAMFWFHPMVWWIGSRMVLERERACDEATVQLMGKPDIYAESLLKASRFCAELPIACVSGIGGADLRQRIVRIMTGDAVLNLTLTRKLLLGTVAFLSLTVPVVAGVVRAASTQDNHTAANGKQLEFAVVSIRRNKANGSVYPGAPTPGGYAMKNMFLAWPILSAYVPQTGGASAYSTKQIIGLPAWSFSDEERYDISAKVEEADLADWHNPAKQPAMLRAMLQSMLADRLKLVVHRSIQENPVYSLTVGKNGPKFKESDPAEPHPGAYPFMGGGMTSVERKDGELTQHLFGISIGQLTNSLRADRTVQDNTGLTGKYDITLQMPLAESIPPGQQQQPPAQVSPFSLAEQIGLKLEPAKGQVETLVIDHIERPSEN